MDITPQLLREVSFKEAWRGFDRDEVNEFLERVGAGVSQLQGRLREALDRAETAEARVASSGGRSEVEDTLRRTLVLAQRTADAAVAEAQDTAARLVAEAEDRARRTTSEAEAGAAVLLAEAEAETRRVAEATRGPLLVEIRELERARVALRADIELLESHLATQRDRLRAQVAELQVLLDQPGVLETEALPDTSGIDLSSTETETETEARRPEPQPSIEPESADDVEARVARPEPVVERPSARPERVERFTPPTFDDPPPVARASAPAEIDPVDEHPTQAFEFDRFEPSPGNDPFLDQLRRAVSDEDATSGADPALQAFFESDTDDQPRSRFGRRR